MPDINHEVIASYGHLSLTVLTALIAMLVYRTTRQIAKMEHLRHLTDQWQQINMLLIQDRVSFEAAFKFGYDGESIEEHKIEENFKKNQIAAMFLNMAEGYYRGRKLGYIEDAIAENGINNVARFFKADKDYAYGCIDAAYRTDFGSFMKDRIKKYR